MKVFVRNEAEMGRRRLKKCINVSCFVYVCVCACISKSRKKVIYIHKYDSFDVFLKNNLEFNELKTFRNVLEK